MSETLKVAICFGPGAVLVDVSGPMEQLSFIFEGSTSIPSFFPFPVTLKPTFLAPTLDPIIPASMVPKILADKTYTEAMDEQFDIIIVGGLDGPNRPIPPEELAFLGKQIPGAKHVITVCVGALTVALTGHLDGKKATLTKAAFDIVTAAAPKVLWQRKARWVVDGKFWTSAGPMSGYDMGNAFLEFIAGKRIADTTRLLFEFPKREDMEDEFAEIWAGPDAPKLWAGPEPPNIRCLDINSAQ